MKAMCPNLFTGQEHFTGSAQLLFPRSAECLTPQRVRRRFRLGRFARLRFLRERCGLGCLFSVAFAQAKGARRLRRFCGGQPWVCSECQARGTVPTLKRPKGHAPAAFGVGTPNKYEPEVSQNDLESRGRPAQCSAFFLLLLSAMTFCSSSRGISS